MSDSPRKCFFNNFDNALRDFVVQWMKIGRDFFELDDKTVTSVIKYNLKAELDNYEGLS